MFLMAFISLLNYLTICINSNIIQFTISKRVMFSVWVCVCSMLLFFNLLMIVMITSNTPLMKVLFMKDLIKLEKIMVITSINSYITCLTLTLKIVKTFPISIKLSVNKEIILKQLLSNKKQPPNLLSNRLSIQLFKLLLPSLLKEGINLMSLFKLKQLLPPLQLSKRMIR